MSLGIYTMNRTGRVDRIYTVNRTGRVEPTAETWHSLTWYLVGLGIYTMNRTGCVEGIYIV